MLYAWPQGKLLAKMFPNTMELYAPNQEAHVSGRLAAGRKSWKGRPAVQLDTWTALHPRWTARPGQLAWLH